VHDRQTHATTRVSVNSAGEPANDNSSNPAISADGRYVAFVSHAGNLDPGANANHGTDVFVHDRDTGTTELVALSSSGEPADQPSHGPSISGDGRYVAFASFATNLTDGEPSFLARVFVRDRTAGTTQHVSVSSAGEAANSASDSPRISADGNSVTFFSLATNLVPGDTNDRPDQFVHERSSGTTFRASVSSAGVQADETSGGGALSDDGRYVAFESFAANLAAGPAGDDNADVFVHDRATGVTERVSVGPGGVQGNDNSGGAMLSADGRFVAFHSGATNLIPSGERGVFIHDRKSPTAATTWLGLKNSDDQGTRFDVRAELYQNGTRVAEAETRCVTGLTRNANQAAEVAIPFSARPDLTVASGDVLSLVISTRIGTNPDGTKCPGHANATGLRLYFDAASRPAGFAIDIAETETEFFLHASGATRYFDLQPPTAASAKTKDSTGVHFAGGNPWKEVGTWTRTQP
jgi:Tol biopolymer transport system component